MTRGVPVAAETGGLTAVAVYVDEGSYVRQGQPLVQMNDVLLRAQLRQQREAVANHAEGHQLATAHTRGHTDEDQPDERQP